MEHASPIIKRSFRWYWLLALRSMGLAISVYLLTLGSALAGLAIAVLLDGFGIAHLTVEGSTGSMLGSGLVIGVVGALALGLASEMNSNRPPLRQDLARAGGVATGVAIAIVGAISVVFSPWVEGRVTGFPAIFGNAASFIDTVGRAGLVVAVLGGLATGALRYLPQSAPYADKGEVPVLYLLWVLIVMSFAR